MLLPSRDNNMPTLGKSIRNYILTSFDRGLLVSDQDRDESEKRIEAARLAHKAKLQARKDARLQSTVTAATTEPVTVSADRTATQSGAPTADSTVVRGSQLADIEDLVANPGQVADVEISPVDTEIAQAESPSIISSEATPANTITGPSNTVAPLIESGRDIVAPISSFGDSRRAKRPGIAGQKVPRSLMGGSNRFNPYESSGPRSVRSPTSLEVAPRQFVHWKNPAWMSDIRIDSSKLDREVSSWLLRFREQVQAFERTADQDYLVRIRQLLHRLERLPVNASLIKKSHIIHDNVKDGLPQIFEGNRDAYPFDIRADAEVLAIKWARRDFDPDIMRGIDLSGKTLRLKAEDDGHDQMKSNEFGGGTFVNGQWWPNRLTLFRDRAHGVYEAGIHGKSGEGAYSIVVSESGYADEDYGDSLLYCGTKKKEDSTDDTSSTQLLVHSHLNMEKDDKGVRRRRPVRVFRTYKMGDKSLYRPEKGIRYDGLYEVVGFEQLRPDMKRFRLERLAGQDPIRYAGPAKRPTAEEMAEFDRFQKLRYDK